MPHRSGSEVGLGTDSDTRSRRSDYQRASEAYYRALRRTHSGVYSAVRRIEEERQEKRYLDVTPPEIAADIRNLATFIVMLEKLCGRGSDVRGIDFGCGSHWFADFARREYAWSVVGYDPDGHAIELARRRFPQSAAYYECLDPVHAGLPGELSTTQTFVFCNAVLQHLDDREVDLALAEMSRVLVPGGICMLIFKRWEDAPAGEEVGMDKAPRILDPAEGRVLFYDPTMERAIKGMAVGERNGLDADMRRGWRLFHVFRVERVVEMAARQGLNLATAVPLESGQTTTEEES